MSTPPLNPVIPRLLALWQQTIGPLHHKSRDCFFAISLQLSTFEEPCWAVEHNGYLMHRYDTETFPTYQAAEARLIELLAEGIRVWVTPNEGEEADHEHSPETVAGILAAVDELVGPAPAVAGEHP